MAFKAKKQKLNWVTPILVARYPSLRTLKVFKQEGQPDGKPRYECNGIIDPADLPEVKAFLNDLAAQWFPDDDFRKIPVAKDKKDNQVHYIKAHSGADYLVPMFDAKNRPIPDGKDLGSGSKIRLALALTEYRQGGVPGITAYLNQVQVLEFVEPNDRTKSQFGAMDGYEYEEDEQGAEEDSGEVKSQFGSIDPKQMHNF